MAADCAGRGGGERGVPDGARSDPNVQRERGALITKSLTLDLLNLIEQQSRIYPNFIVRCISFPSEQHVD